LLCVFYQMFSQGWEPARDRFSGLFSYQSSSEEQFAFKKKDKINFRADDWIPFS
jgi:hypothetical protein